MSENEPYYQPPMGKDEDWFGADDMNALRTEFSSPPRRDGREGTVPAGHLSTLVWNIHNTYLAMPGATFTNRQMQMVVEGFMAEVERLRALASVNGHVPGCLSAESFGQHNGLMSCCLGLVPRRREP